MNNAARLASGENVRCGSLPDFKNISEKKLTVILLSICKAVLILVHVFRPEWMNAFYFLINLKAFPYFFIIKKMAYVPANY